MTDTDHNIIARACALVGLVPCVWGLKGEALVYCSVDTWDKWLKNRDGEVFLPPGETYPINDALHVLLVWKLAMAVAARPYVWHGEDTEKTCIEMTTGGESWDICRLTAYSTLGLGPDDRPTNGLREPIDIIRVLVDALEGEG